MENTFNFFSFIGERIVLAGQFFFRSVFYSIDEWLDVYPESGLLSFLDKLAELIGLSWLTDLSIFELVFSPYGLWIVFTILLVYFVIP